MKYLSNYTEKPISELLEQTGSFFAFSNKQFSEKKAKNLKPEDYTHLFGGLIAPKSKTTEVLKGLAEINEKGIKQDIEENGIDAIIQRELNNHECYYTGDIHAAVDALEPYDITEDQIRKVYKGTKKKL